MEENSIENAPITTSLAPKKWYKRAWVKDVLSSIAIIVFIIIPFRIFIAQPYLVDGSSMDPTFKNNEYLIVDQLSYRLGDPKRGDVVIFKYPVNPDQYFIKRIIGLPGETVILDNSGTSIKNPATKEILKIEEPYVAYKQTSDTSFTLNEGEYFVMGDNRGASSDSRVWGAVPRKNIVGRPFLALYPLDKIKLLPGALSSFK